MKKHQDVSFAMSHGWVSYGASDSAEVVLLLHGFMQESEGMLMRLQSAFPQHIYAVGLDAPFPVSKEDKGRQESKLSYAWYFFDPRQPRYLTPMAWAVDYVLSFLTRLGLKQRVTRVVGFSQGGYLAPYVALALPGVKQVIGIQARFRDEDLVTRSLPFRMDAINGDSDPVVEPCRVRESHRKLREAGVQGEDVWIPKGGHRIDADVRRALGRLLEQRI